MDIHHIYARDLPDLWFQAVHDILDHGKRFVIDRGSYEGQTRLEYDYFTGHVKHPGTDPLIPDIPPACGIPNPVEYDYIYGGPGYDRAYIEYLMSARKEPGESYTYGERLTRVPLSGDKLSWWQAANTEIIDKREVDGTVVFATGHCENTQANSKDIHLIINNTDLGSIGTLAGGANATFVNTLLNLDFVQGDRIRLQAQGSGSGNILDTVVKITIKWRG